MKTCVLTGRVRIGVQFLYLNIIHYSWLIKYCCWYYPYRKTLGCAWLFGCSNFYPEKVVLKTVSQLKIRTCVTGVEQPSIWATMRLLFYGARALFLPTPIHQCESKVNTKKSGEEDEDDRKSSCFWYIQIILAYCMSRK